MKSFCQKAYYVLCVLIGIVTLAAPVTLFFMPDANQMILSFREEVATGSLTWLSGDWWWRERQDIENIIYYIPFLCWGGIILTLFWLIHVCKTVIFAPQLKERKALEQQLEEIAKKIRWVFNNESLEVDREKQAVMASLKESSSKADTEEVVRCKQKLEDLKKIEHAMTGDMARQQYIAELSKEKEKIKKQIAKINESHYGVIFIPQPWKKVE